MRHKSPPHQPSSLTDCLHCEGHRPLLKAAAPTLAQIQDLQAKKMALFDYLKMLIIHHKAFQLLFPVGMF